MAVLAERVRGTGVHDLYVHDGPLGGDGSLDPARSPKAAWAVRALRAAMPGVRVQAWLGQQVGREKGDLNVDDPATRARVVASARQVLDAGFDGVHYDLEPLPTGDQGLLALLDATGAMAHPRGDLVSIAAHHVAPLPGFASAGNVIVGHPKWWSPGYLHEVARRVDQLGGHSGSAETVGPAIRGTRLALGGDPRERFGVALYADFAATESDWSVYHRDWCP